MRDGNDKVNLELVEDMKLHPGTLVRLIFFSEAESGALVCAGVEIGVGIVQTTWK